MTSQKRPRSSVRSHSPTGGSKPRLPRRRIAGGSTSRNARRRMRLPRSARIFQRPGIRNAHSTRRWSRNGTRTSRALAMLERSTLASMFPGSPSRQSVYSMRLIASPWSTVSNPWASAANSWLTAGGARRAPARLARDLEARQERGVGERLVEIVEGRLQRREHLRTGQGNLRVDAAELSRHRAAEPRLVEDRVFGEGHGEGAQRGGAGRRGQAADDRGIDAAAQKGAHRHVRHQVLPHGGREERAELLLRGRFRAVPDPGLAGPG